MRTAVMTASILLGISGPALAERFWPISQDRDSVTFVDLDSLNTQGAPATIWGYVVEFRDSDAGQMAAKFPPELNDKSIAALSIRYAVDCAAERVASSDLAMYNKTGQWLYTVSGGVTDWQTAPPNTKLRAVYEAACKGGGQKAPHFTYPDNLTPLGFLIGAVRDGYKKGELKPTQ